MHKRFGRGPRACGCNCTSFIVCSFENATVEASSPCLCNWPSCESCLFFADRRFDVVFECTSRNSSSAIRSPLAASKFHRGFPVDNQLSGIRSAHECAETGTYAGIVWTTQAVGCNNHPAQIFRFQSSCWVLHCSTSWVALQSSATM